MSAPSHLRLTLLSVSLLILPLLSGLIACQPASTPRVADDELLMPMFSLWPEDAAGPSEPPALHLMVEERCSTWRPTRPHAIAVDTSQRSALLSRETTMWQSQALSAHGRTLELAVAALVPCGDPDGDPAGEPIGDHTAVLEWIETTDAAGRAGESPESTASQELWRGVVSAEVWEPLGLTLPKGSGSLRLSSTGPGAVAWAELQLVATERDESLKPPNLILVSLDTVRSDHLSTYGYSRSTSPNLDRLAAESFVFERSFSASTWTLPSTASLLTGLLPRQHGLLALGQQLPSKVETLAERLRDQGYRSVAFTDGGFAGYDHGFSQGFGRYDITRGAAWQPKDVAEVVAEASAWLAENRFEPYFLFLHTYEAHQPHINPEGFADPFLDPTYDGRFRHRAAFEADEAETLSEADVAQLVALYDGEIRRADHYLGAFLDTLRASSSWSETAVLVTSDHGEEFLEYGDSDHGFGKVFDPNVRVPWILKPPASAVATEVGQRFEQPVSGLDVTPTLLSLAGLQPGGALMGRPLLSAEGRIDPRANLTLVHGTNSFPDLDEERFRLDQPPLSIIFDRVRRQAQWTNLSLDPDWNAPQQDFDEDAAKQLEARLQATLAWLHDGTFVVRLPDAMTSLEVPGTSKIEPLGLWDGWRWTARTPAAGAEPSTWRTDSTPERGHYLVFAPRADRLRETAGETTQELAWQIYLAIGSEPATPYDVAPRASEPYAWHPFGSTLPEVGKIFPTASSFQPGATQLSDESLAELKALGYIQ